MALVPTWAFRPVDLSWGNGGGGIWDFWPGGLWFVVFLVGFFGG